MPSRVINVFNNGHAERWMKIIGTRESAGSGHHYFAISCTPNHMFWNPLHKRYITAEQLVVGDQVNLIRHQLELTPVQFSVLLGKLLGDGSLAFRKNSSTSSVTWGHRLDHEEYTRWAARALGDIAGPFDVRMSGYGTTMSRCRTIFHPDIGRTFAAFIGSDGTKIVPYWLPDRINPLALAFWYMDDGSLVHHYGQEDRALIAVCGFTRTDCNVLLAALARFGITGQYYEDNRGYANIRMNSDDAERLFLLIAPYVPTVMQYKLPERYRGHEGWLPPSRSAQYKPLLTTQRITRIVPYDTTYSSHRYDLETETHNFFANGVLVHNSNVCLRHDALYARSHTSSPDHPSFSMLKVIHNMVQQDIPEHLSIFGEWVYAQHSIHYDHLPSCLFVIAIRDETDGMWLSWRNVRLWCDTLALTHVPVLQYCTPETEEQLKWALFYHGQGPSVYGPVREGVVVRNIGGFSDENFRHCLAKWVRKDHVQTDEHWMNKPIIRNKMLEEA